MKMNVQKLFVAFPIALLVLGNGAVQAGQSIDEAFALGTRRPTSGTLRSQKKATSWSTTPADA